MRRHGQHYQLGGSGDAYSDRMPHASNQRMDYRSSNFQRREQAVASERGHDNYGFAKEQEPWRSERDGSMPKPFASGMLEEGGGGEISRSSYQDQRAGLKSLILDQGNIDSASQHQQQDMDTRYEDHSIPQSFVGLEKKFFDELIKLSEEQKDLEDAEYVRHKEKLDTINVQYQEQMTMLRANQASRREVLLQRESDTRQQQYQQAMLDQYYNSTTSKNTHSYHDSPPASASARDTHGPHSTITTSYTNSKDSYNKYNQRGHFSTGFSDHHRSEPRQSYASGRSRGFQ